MNRTNVVTASTIARSVQEIGKSMFAKVAALGLIAGAMAFATPAQANAQVSFGVRIGRPVVYAPPAYVRPYPVHGGAYFAGPAYRPYGYARDRFYDRGHDRRDFDRDHRDRR